jgi:hypothetical protein
MTQMLALCGLALLLSAAAPSRAAEARTEPAAAPQARKPVLERRPGFSWYLGVGCVSLLALQRMRGFSPHRRRRPPPG